jgi:hypothetical protein
MVSCQAAPESNLFFLVLAQALSTVMDSPQRSVPVGQEDERLTFMAVREAQNAEDAVTHPSSRQVGSTARSGFRWRILLVLTGLFALSRMIYALAGIRFQMLDRIPKQGSFLPYFWQLLDPNLLQHHLLASVWNLNSQPPLFNLGIGILLKLPFGSQEPVAQIVFLLLGLAIVLSTYLILVELRVPTWLAFAVSVFVIVNPTYVLYENWLSWSYPTAAFLTFSVLCLLRFLRTRSVWWGFGFFSSVMIVIFLDSAYQLPWLAAALVIAFVVARRQWRSVAVAAVLPVLLVVGWVIKDASQVGTFTTSSWLGMNLTRTTLDSASPQQINAMIKAKTLTPIAAVPAFSPVDDYVPKYAHLPRGGSPAVDAPTIAPGIPNYNNSIYVAVSNQYLHDDLAFIRARPGRYASEVFSAAKLWTFPSDEYAYVLVNWLNIRPWSNFFDRTVLLRPAAKPSSVVGAAQLSYSTILVYLCAIIGTPIVIWRRRRDDPAAAAGLAYLVVTVLYSFAATSLIELGENQRFAMELGPLPLIAAVVVVVTALRGWRASDRKPDRSALTEPSPPGVLEI